MDDFDDLDLEAIAAVEKQHQATMVGGLSAVAWQPPSFKTSFHQPVAPVLAPAHQHQGTHSHSIHSLSITTALQLAPSSRQNQTTARWTQPQTEVDKQNKQPLPSQATRWSMLTATIATTDVRPPSQTPAADSQQNLNIYRSLPNHGRSERNCELGHHCAQHPMHRPAPDTCLPPLPGNHISEDNSVGACLPVQQLAMPSSAAFKTNQAPLNMPARCDSGLACNSLRDHAHVVSTAAGFPDGNLTEHQVSLWAKQRGQRPHLAHDKVAQHQQQLEQSKYQSQAAPQRPLSAPSVVSATRENLLATGVPLSPCGMQPGQQHKLQVSTQGKLRSNSSSLPSHACEVNAAHMLQQELSEGHVQGAQFLWHHQSNLLTEQTASKNISRLGATAVAPGHQQGAGCEQLLRLPLHQTALYNAGADHVQRSNQAHTVAGRQPTGLTKQLPAGVLPGSPHNQTLTSTAAVNTVEVLHETGPAATWATYGGNTLQGHQLTPDHSISPSTKHHDFQQPAVTYQQAGHAVAANQLQGAYMTAKNLTSAQFLPQKQLVSMAILQGSSSRDLQAAYQAHAPQLPPAASLLPVQPVAQSEQAPNNNAAVVSAQVDTMEVSASAYQVSTDAEAQAIILGPADPEVVTTVGGHKVHKEHTRHWLYPKDMPLRQYQYKMVATALHHNTLVCLPTGLGKTLIAAVVMLNFYRWFPEGKLVFVAPTRPLVAQQKQACVEKTGMPEEDVAELSGAPDKRKTLWQSKRVFFCTPHLLKNDLETGRCPEDKIICLVVDECHRATGDYPAAVVVRDILRKKQAKFRVLALSATPGSSVDAVQDVLKNLMIHKVAFRSEEDYDVAPYCHRKQVDVVEVEPGKDIELCQSSLFTVMRPIIHELGRLQVYNCMDVERVARFSLIMAEKNYNDAVKAGTGNRQAGGYIHLLFQQAILLASLNELLTLQGPGMASEYLNTELASGRKSIQSLQSDARTSAALRELQQRLQVLNRTQHPKLRKLEQVVLEHLQQQGPSTTEGMKRVIIFTSLRESVKEIKECLDKHAPVIQARIFIGQGSGTKGKKGDVKAGEPDGRLAGMDQQEQKEVLQQFRNGSFNTLVATCIGEEGLDIPEVDLIVCYDSSSSPTRNIQRMGRTGRHREGRCVYVLAKGREADNYYQSQEKMRQLQARLRMADRSFTLCTTNPRLLPQDCNPKPVLLNLQKPALTKNTAKKGAAGKRTSMDMEGQSGADALAAPLSSRLRHQKRHPAAKKVKRTAKADLPDAGHLELVDSNVIIAGSYSSMLAAKQRHMQCGSTPPSSPPFMNGSVSPPACDAAAAGRPVMNRHASHHITEGMPAVTSSPEHCIAGGTHPDPVTGAASIPEWQGTHSMDRSYELDCNGIAQLQAEGNQTQLRSNGCPPVVANAGHISQQRLIHPNSNVVTPAASPMPAGTGPCTIMSTRSLASAPIAYTPLDSLPLAARLSGGRTGTRNTCLENAGSTATITMSSCKPDAANSTVASPCDLHSADSAGARVPATAHGGETQHIAANSSPALQPQKIMGFDKPHGAPVPRSKTEAAAGLPPIKKLKVSSKAAGHQPQGAQLHVLHAAVRPNLPDNQSLSAVTYQSAPFSSINTQELQAVAAASSKEVAPDVSASEPSPNNLCASFSNLHIKPDGTLHMPSDFQTAMQALLDAAYSAKPCQQPLGSHGPQDPVEAGGSLDKSETGRPTGVTHLSLASLLRPLPAHELLKLAGEASASHPWAFLATLHTVEPQQPTPEHSIPNIDAAIGPVCISHAHAAAGTANSLPPPLPPQRASGQKVSKPRARGKKPSGAAASKAAPKTVPKQIDSAVAIKPAQPSAAADVICLLDDSDTDAAPPAQTKPFSLPHQAAASLPNPQRVHAHAGKQPLQPAHAVPGTDTTAVALAGNHAPQPLCLPVQGQDAIIFDPDNLIMTLDDLPLISRQVPMRMHATSAQTSHTEAPGLACTQPPGSSHALADLSCKTAAATLPRPEPEFDPDSIQLTLDDLPIALRAGSVKAPVTVDMQKAVPGMGGHKTHACGTAKPFPHNESWPSDREACDGHGRQSPSLLMPVQQTHHSSPASAAPSPSVCALGSKCNAAITGSAAQLARSAITNNGHGSLPRLHSHLDGEHAVAGGENASAASQFVFAAAPVEAQMNSPRLWRGHDDTQQTYVRTHAATRLPRSLADTQQTAGHAQTLTACSTQVGHGSMECTTGHHPCKLESHAAAHPTTGHKPSMAISMQQYTAVQPVCMHALAAASSAADDALPTQKEKAVQMQGRSCMVSTTCADTSTAMETTQCVQPQQHDARLANFHFECPSLEYEAACCNDGTPVTTEQPACIPETPCSEAGDSDNDDMVLATLATQGAFRSPLRPLQLQFPTAVNTATDMQQSAVSKGTMGNRDSSLQQSSSLPAHVLAPAVSNLDNRAAVQGGIEQQVVSASIGDATTVLGMQSDIAHIGCKEKAALRAATGAHAEAQGAAHGPGTCAPASSGQAGPMRSLFARRPPAATRMPSPGMVAATPGPPLLATSAGSTPAWPTDPRLVDMHTRRVWDSPGMQGQHGNTVHAKDSEYDNKANHADHDSRPHKDSTMSKLLAAVAGQSTIAGQTEVGNTYHIHPEVHELQQEEQVLDDWQFYNEAYTCGNSFPGAAEDGLPEHGQTGCTVGHDATEALIDVAGASCASGDDATALPAAQQTSKHANALGTPGVADGLQPANQHQPLAAACHHRQPVSAQPSPSPMPLARRIQRKAAPILESPDPTPHVQPGTRNPQRVVIGNTPIVSCTDGSAPVPTTAAVAASGFQVPTMQHITPFMKKKLQRKRMAGVLDSEDESDAFQQAVNKQAQPGGHAPSPLPSTGGTILLARQSRGQKRLRHMSAVAATGGAPADGTVIKPRGNQPAHRPAKPQADGKLAAHFFDEEADLSDDGEDYGEDDEEYDGEGEEMDSFLASRSPSQCGRSPGSMLAIYRCGLASQTPGSFDGDIGALMRRRGLGPRTRPGNKLAALDTPMSETSLHSDDPGIDITHTQAEPASDGPHHGGRARNLPAVAARRNAAVQHPRTSHRHYIDDHDDVNGDRIHIHGYYDEDLDEYELDSMDEDKINDDGSDALDNDVCAACGMHGELVICDGCDSAWHLKCAGLRLVPSGKWFCQICHQ